MKTPLPALTFFIPTFLLIFSASAQYSVTEANATITEDFNGLNAADLSGLADGWLIENNGVAVSAATVDNGSSTTAGVFSYGSTAAADRALGFLDDGSTSFEAGWELTNNTGQTITHLAVNFNGEQWRISDVERVGNQTTQFSYKIGSGLSGGTFTDVNALNYTTVDCNLFFGNCNNGGAANGNGNQESNTAVIDLGAGLADGETIVLKWELPNPDDADDSHGTGIDDVSVTFLVVEAGVWYLEPVNADDAETPASWTQYANGTSSATIPVADADDIFTEDNQTFIINSDVTVSTFTGFGVGGANSKIVIAENANVTFELAGNDDHGYNIELEDNATLTFVFAGNPNMDGYTGAFDGNTAPAVNIAASGVGSNVIYTEDEDGTGATGTICGGTYYNLTLTEADDFFDDEYVFSTDITVTNAFTYDYPYDATTLSGNPTVTFDNGGTTLINCAGYSGAGGIPHLTVADGTTLQLGTVNANSITLSHGGEIEGNLDLASGESLVVANSTLTNAATGNITLPENTSISCTGTGSLVNNGALTLESDASISLATGDLTNSGTLTLEETGSITSTSGDLSNSGTLDIQANGTVTLTSGDLTNDGTFHVGSNGFVTVTAGVLTNTSTFNIADDGSLVQGTGSTVSNSGTFNVTRNKPDGQAAGLYNFWSTPVRSTYMSEFNAGRRYQLNAPGTSFSDWTVVDNGSELTVGRGYALTGVESTTFTGTPNNGNVSYEATHDGTANDNYNVLGNPYPSAINAEDFLTSNSTVLGGSILLFNHNTNTEYTAVNQQIAINNLGASVAGDTNIAQTLANTFIASGQGFYVPIINNAGGTVTFTNAMRGGNNSDFKSAQDQIKGKFFLQLVDEGKRFTTLFGVVEGTTFKEDWGWDTRTGSGGSFVINSLDISGQNYIIQSIPELDKTTSIPLHVAVPRKGTYEIHLEGSEYMDFGQVKPMLLDVEEGTLVEALNEDLTFTAHDAGELANRFFLVFGKTSFTTDISELVADQATSWYSVNQGEPTLYTNMPKAIEAVRLFDVSGKQLMEMNTIEPSMPLTALKEKHGVYIAVVSYGNGNTEQIKISF